MEPPQLTQQKNGSWHLNARIPGITDFEHNSCRALSFNLIGVTFDMVLDGFITGEAWIGTELDQFRIPEPNYDPRIDAKKCKHCKTPDNEEHLMGSEGSYIPPINEKLFSLMAGKKVKISIYPTKE